MLLITKSLPFHCNKSPATDAVGTKSKLPFVFLNAILFVFPAATPKLTDAVTLLKVTLLFVFSACPTFPSKVSNLLSTELLNAVTLAALALNEVATELLNAVTLAALALNEVATEELKFPVTLATEELKDEISALLALNEVATEELNVE